MSSAAAAFPSPDEFIEPLHAITSWKAPLDRNAARVARDASILRARLDYLVGLEVEIHNGVDAPERVASFVAEAEEQGREALHALRLLHRELTAGLALQRVLRDVRRFAPHLEDGLRQTLAAAVDQLREMRAVLALMLDEDDDAEVGIELVPVAGAPLSPEPSRPL
jgi:hypothetical protein